MTNQANHVYDAHVANWLKTKFNLTVEYNGNFGYMCWLGDFDLGIKHASNDTRFSAAVEHAACHDGALCDKLVALEMGE